MKTSPIYKDVLNHAVDMAKSTGLDVGIEKMREFNRVVFSCFFLPKPENRTGRELSCEVITAQTPKMEG